MAADVATPEDEAVRFMRAALDHAREAVAFGEVPIGAVVVLDGTIVGSSASRRTYSC